MLNHPTSKLIKVSAVEIAQSFENAPSAPQVLPLLQKLLQDHDSSIDAIAEAIKLDPGVSAQVLRAGNSAVYSRGDRCSTIVVAVNRIGLDSIYEMVCTVMAEGILMRTLKSYDIKAEAFWLSSLASAIACENICRIANLDPHVGYTLGLFSNVGQVAIDGWIQANNPQAKLTAQSFPNGYLSDELEYVGCSSQQVGAQVLSNWNFSLEMSLPVRWQKTPLAADSHRKLAMALHCARWVSLRVTDANSSTETMPSEQILNLLKLHPGKLNELNFSVYSQLLELQRKLSAFSGEAE